MNVSFLSMALLLARSTLWAFVLVQGVIPSHAQATRPDSIILHPAASDTATRPLGPTDPEELEAFLDGLFEGMLEAHHIAGGVVAVVRGDSLLLAKGYGYEDVESRAPVRAGETLFRIASISKLFVWTAVMQLAAQDKLDLDADVNTYLTDFQVPATFEEPVTLKHLMTHTAGFEDQVIGLFARDSARVRPLGDILREELPERIWPTGEVASYSNHGTGIAAYIVEQVSGQPFNEYVEQHILDPLGMTRSTFRQPLPARLRNDVSKGYRYRGGTFQEQPFVYTPMAPIGGGSSTATDMARFMLAHLHAGSLGDAAVLDSATARLMQSPLFEPAPGVSPIAYGFVGERRNGQTLIGHNGAIFWFHSMLLLVPEHETGIFVSFNSEMGSAALSDVIDAFMNRYFPADEVPQGSPSADGGDRLRRFAGSYRSVRYSHTTLAKLGATFSSVNVAVTDDGLLKTDGREVIRWVETENPLMFREERGLRILSFKEDDRGNPAYLYFGNLPVIAFEKVGLTDLPSFNRGVFFAAVLLFLGTLIFWPVAAGIRRRHGVKLDEDSRIPVAAYWFVWGACLLLLVFAIGLADALSDPNQIAIAVPPGLKALLWLPLIAVVLTLGGLAFAVRMWLSGRGSLVQRMYYTVVTLGCVAVLWQLNHWNLLGFYY